MADDESPFGKASVMKGYPLDKSEKDAVERTIDLASQESSRGTSYSISSTNGGNVNGKPSKRRRRLRRLK